MFQRLPDGDYWMGYADAKPSESINRKEFPAIGVAAVFLYHPSVSVLEVPGGQYKEYNRKQKGSHARKLANWLTEAKDSGLVISGFAHAHTLTSAAALGIELIEEIRGAHVVPHHEKYRLRFGREAVDLAQAVALEYYRFTAEFGFLPARKKLLKELKNLLLLMDRFPGASPAVVFPGIPTVPTQGFKFINYARDHSATGVGIRESNESSGVKTKLGTLDWWSDDPRSKPREGRSHPHFRLPDWLAAAAIAHSFRELFIESFTKEAHGSDAADGLEELYQAFKSFDIWSFDESVIPRIKASKKLWTMPKDARDFILAKT